MARVKRRKSTAKKLTTVTASPALRDVKKEIRQAVADIPAMLAREVKPEEPQKAEPVSSAPPVDNNYIHTYSVPNSGANSSAMGGKKFLLWFGVSTVTVLILGMWVWNMRTVFLDLKPWQSQEADIWKKAKLDLEDIWQNSNVEEGLKKLSDQSKVAGMAAQEKKYLEESKSTTVDQEKIKESLKLIFTASATSTAVATSTANTSTSKDKL